MCGPSGAKGAHAQVKAKSKFVLIGAGLQIVVSVLYWAAAFGGWAVRPSAIMGCLGCTSGTTAFGVGGITATCVTVNIGTVSAWSGWTPELYSASSLNSSVVQLSLAVFIIGAILSLAVFGLALCACSCRKLNCSVLPLLALSIVSLICGIVGEAAGGNQMATLKTDGVTWGAGFGCGIAGLFVCALSAGLFAADLLVKPKGAADKGHSGAPPPHTAIPVPSEAAPKAAA